MKIYSNQHTFSHPFSTISAAHWQKYPNPIQAHVISCDVISRHTQDNILYTERLIVCQDNPPSLIRKLIKLPTEAYFREVSTLNLSTKTYTSTTTNLTLSSVVNLKETCEYTPLNSKETIMKQTCEVNCDFGIFGKYIEEQAVTRFGEKSILGKLGIEWVVEKISKEKKEFHQIE